jgi:hypothetical protein
MDTLDLLEGRASQLPTGFTELMMAQNDLLFAILKEIRRTHPDQRTVLDLQFTNPLRVLAAVDDRVRIRFLNEGKPVKSLYTLVSNNCDQVIGIGINEPVLTNATDTSGYQLAIGGKVEIEAEIEFLEIGVVAGGAVSVGINNSAGLATNGVVAIYGWTLPSEAR